MIKEKHHKKRERDEEIFPSNQDRYSGSIKKKKKKQLRLRKNHKTDDAPENENNFFACKQKRFLVRRNTQTHTPPHPPPCSLIDIHTHTQRHQASDHFKSNI